VTNVGAPDSAALQAHESSAAVDRTFGDYPALIARAAGARLWDTEGKEYIDFCSGSAVTNAGHGNSEITQAVARQMGTGAYHVGALLASTSRAEVVARLMDVVPNGLSRVHLTATGGEAVEAALKIARFHTKRQNVIAFWGAFHGRTMGALALTAHRGIRDPFFPMSIGAAHFPYPGPYRNAFGLPASDEAQVLSLSLQLLESALSDPASGLSPVAAIIVEPIQGVGGIVLPPAGFLRSLRELCDRHSIILIVDECFTGFGRSGAWFACQHDGITPDMMVVSKGFSGSFPIAGVVGNDALMGSLPIGLLSTSFEGNPVACAAAVASIDYLQSIDAPARARSIGDRLGAWLSVHRTACVGDVRGIAAMWGLEIVEPGTGAVDPGGALAIQREALHQGLVLYRAGHNGNVLGLLPPLNATDADLEEGLRILGRVIS
jgi:4-aminobutyrate aminotransferase